MLLGTPQLPNKQMLRHMNMSAIDNWGECHQDEEGWVNPEAKQTYNTMDEQIKKQKQVNENAILGKVLGQHRGHKNGLGLTLPHFGFVPTSHDDQSGESLSSFMLYQDDVHVLMHQVIFFRDVIACLVPDIRLPPIQPPVVPSSWSSADTHDADDDDNSDDALQD